MISEVFELLELLYLLISGDCPHFSQVSFMHEYLQSRYQVVKETIPGFRKIFRQETLKADQRKTDGDDDACFMAHEARRNQRY